MEHTIRIERLFTLGNYKNIKICVETAGIPDEIWNDPEACEQLRLGLQQDVITAYKEHLELIKNEKDD